MMIEKPNVKTFADSLKKLPKEKNFSVRQLGEASQVGQQEDGSLSGKLWAVSTKVRAIAHLIETQRNPEWSPLDIAEINFGIASILFQCAHEVRDASTALEESEFIKRRVTYKNSNPRKNRK